MKKILVYFLVVVLAYGPTFNAFAAYARLTPPAGWSPGGSAAVNTFRFASAATATTVLLGRINANAALTVAGSSYAIPVGLKLGVTAASKAAEWSFGNPYFFVALLAGSAAYGWYKSNNLEVIDGKWVKKENVPCTSGCLEYSMGGRVLGQSGSSEWTSSVSAAAAGFAQSINVNSGGMITASLISCSGMNCTFQPSQKYDDTVHQPVTASATSRTATSGSSVAYRPIGLPEFDQIMAPQPVPDAVPKQLPDVAWPVENPVVNPDPADKSKPTPIWLPTGDPVKNPNPSPSTTPDSWTQPGVKISPSPTVDDPWRVDVTPDPITKGDPSPNTSSPGVPAPGTNPPAPDKIEIETCGLPGKPKCQIDELDTKRDRGTTFDQSKTDMDTQKDTAGSEIGKAAQIQSPIWTFAFNLPSGCAPFPTGLRGVVIDMCQHQPIIHSLMSMIWAAVTAFTLIGMVGRTIRES